MVLSSSMFSRIRSYPQISPGVRSCVISQLETKFTEHRFAHTIYYEENYRSAHTIYYQGKYIWWQPPGLRSIHCLEWSHKLNRPEGIKATNQELPSKLVPEKQLHTTQWILPTSFIRTLLSWEEHTEQIRISLQPAGLILAVFSLVQTPSLILM
jgi:hypothetical protein